MSYVFVQGLLEVFVYLQLLYWVSSGKKGDFSLKNKSLCQRRRKFGEKKSVCFNVYDLKEHLDIKVHTLTIFKIACFSDIVLQL